jgi:hypothetical protein
MSESTNEVTDPAKSPVFPGAPLPEFASAIKSLRRLSDDGKYTVMLGRSGAVRLVGAADDFRKAFSDEVSREVSAKDISKVLSEIRNFCQLRAFFKGEKAALSFLKDNIYDDEFKELDEEGKAAFLSQLTQKLDLAIGLLPTAYEQRKQRLDTATIACLEDMDAELIRERRDDYQEYKVDQPFLRLRFRYIAASDELPCYWTGPWGGSRSRAAKSFELECDEVDIDVLMFRLAEAKKMLLSAVEASAPKTAASE